MILPVTGFETPVPQKNWLPKISFDKQRFLKPWCPLTRFCFQLKIEPGF